MGEIDRILDRKAEEIMKRLEKGLANAVDAAKRSFAEYVEELKKASRITLPLNLLEIIAKGGDVLSVDVEEQHDIDVEVLVNGVRVMPSVFRGCRYPPGKYRVTLIVERLEEGGRDEEKEA